MGQHSQYNDEDIRWKIWGSNLGRRKRTIFSPKHSDQLQRPPNLQLNENLSFFSDSKVGIADSPPTHKRLETSLKISGAVPPQNLSASMAQSGTTLFYLNLLPKYTDLSRDRTLSGLIKEPFFISITTYMQTT